MKLGEALMCINAIQRVTGLEERAEIMSDSIAMIFKVPPMLLEEACEAWKLSTWVKREGLVLSRGTSGVQTIVTSPLTQAGYVVTPWIDRSDPYSAQFIGFHISVNVPSCVIGLNALIKTDVSSSARVAFYLLKSYLAEKNIAPELISQLRLANSEIRNVTFTYLIPFDSHESALQALAQVTARRDALFWNRSSKEAGSQGKEGDNTWYLNIRNRPQFKMYVKRIELSKTNIPESTKNHVYMVSGRHLRVEVDLTQHELRKILVVVGMEESTEAWRDHELSQKVYALAFEKLRTELRLTDNLRVREMKNTEKATKLTPQQHLILDDYFKGIENAALQKMSNSMRSKFKMTILRRYRIDIDLPWARHRGLPALEWMVLPPPFELDPCDIDLAPYVFNKRTARTAAEALKRYIAAPRVYASALSDEELSNDLMGKAKNPRSGNSIRSFDSLNFPYLRPIPMQ